MYDKLVAEFSTIEETAFWKALLKKVKDHRDTFTTNCETKDNPTRDQGAIIALDLILGRDYLQGRSKYPNIVVRLLDEARKEVSKGV